MERFDAVVIGGGLIGCFAARSLRRWELSVLMLEAREDLCTGISRANTAIVYPGYDHKPGTLKAEMCVRANAGFDRLCRELDLPFSRCGSLMLCFGERGEAVLRKKYQQGLKSAVPGLRLISGEEALEIEPALSPRVRAALYSPSAGTVNPWELGVAACENAVANGLKLRLNTRVSGIRQAEGGYIVESGQAEYFCRAVINCAGLYADKIQELIFKSPVRIVPTAGDYLVLDRAAEGMPEHIVQFEPEQGEKGFTAVPTVEGSLLLGPSEREGGADFATSEAGLRFVRDMARQVLPGLDLSYTIRSFGALRPNPRRPEGGSIGSFVIDEPAPGFLSFIGVKTPGLSCAEELGRYGAERTAAYLKAEPNPSFSPYRQGIIKARSLSFEQRQRLVRENPDYGLILCHCEDITRAEALEAIRRGAVTIDGVKRRAGAGMGRCQGARCQGELAALLARELGIAESAVTLSGAGSELLGGRHEKL